MADQHGDYEMLEELGSGSFGVVYKARERATGELVAIKHIDLDGTDDDIKDIQQEIALLSTCSSPFVTQYKTSFVRGVKLWIVMEYLGGGSCLDLVSISPFNETQAAIVCRELLLGLNYLHQSGKIHRDIKAANVLLSSTGKVKIADFGVAAQLTNIKSQRMTFVGTPFWMAPEVIQEMGYDSKADIWSLGITAIELVNGQPPNADLHPMKALFHIPKNPAPQLHGPQFSRDMKSFVSACLVKNPDYRPTARDLLQHRWIQRAGKVGTLRYLVESRQQQQARGEHANHPKFYEETLRDMSPMKEQDEDDWAFDTIKPAATAFLQHTIKKRKLSQVATPQFDPPCEMMEQLDLRDSSYNAFPTPPSHPTVRNIQRPSVSVATMRRVSSPKKENVQASKQAPSLIAADSVAHEENPSFRKAEASPRKAQALSREGESSACKAEASLRKSSGQKQPLALDLSFGNGQSTTRPFRRVSDESPALGPTEHPSNENTPPAPEATSKEAKLGRRVFSRIVDPAFQEVYAQTASKAKQDAMSQACQAWANLDALDPEGEFLLIKSILERVQNDPKLSALISHPQLPPTSSGPTTPQKQKLVLAQSNPHLESHRQRQSREVSLAGGVSPDRPTGLPGQVRPGMEHTKQFADALYGRWVDGMRTRWPQV